MPRISFHTLRDEVVLTHQCNVATIHYGSRFAGYRLCKRLDDGLYFLMKLKTSNWDAKFYDLVDSSSTYDKIEIMSKIEQLLGA